MDVIIEYSKVQLEAAAKFIEANNPSFKGKLAYVRRSIRDSIFELAEKFPHLSSLSTMGYTVAGRSYRVEGIDNDYNAFTVDITVDPAVDLAYSFEEKLYSFPKQGE